MRSIFVARIAACFLVTLLATALAPSARAEPQTCSWQQADGGAFLGSTCLTTSKCGRPWENKNIHELKWRQKEVCCNATANNCHDTGQYRIYIEIQCGDSC